ncbi:MAG: histidine ammonia-lyase [Woeseia sp.]|nr:histidine ammonia-lyase [Woeseia sp.]MBT8097856.1 histidine ammonia-lyase [Woeseia sp.]NNL55840.1 histidine ammonia-lyase [Woeseia sp.]
MKLHCDGQPVTLAALRTIWIEPAQISLGDDARRRIDESAAVVQKVVDSGKSVYGVNTGFGQLAQVSISVNDLARLQENLVRSHAVGVGPLLPDAIVRLILVMKIVSLAQGYSGVRSELIDTLCALVNHEIYPSIPVKGSVGASGDLAPLAHMAGALLGLGEVSVDGQIMAAKDALGEAGITPLTLAPKEGLALLNGTQVSTALALAALFRAEHVLAAAITSGAMSADAVKGSDTPFDARIQDARGQPGQVAVASLLRTLMQGSEIRASHLECNRVQDPYSIRCQPQVMGACVDVFEHVARVLQTEANAVSDNPLVFAESGDILSGGNFHAEPVAMAADYLALAIAEIGAISERRTALLIDSHLSGLPAFLVRDGGLNSGFMMAQVTAAALASENKSLAHPASVDSLPTSANQEDHVSMATFAAHRLHNMLDNVSSIVAIEVLAAAQGIEFHHPQNSSAVIETIIEQVRLFSPPYETDRSLSGDIEQLADLIDGGSFCEPCRTVLPSFEA